MNQHVSELLADSMSKIRDMVDANTVIGNPITTPQGVTLIPVSKISCGYAGGGSDFNSKNPTRDNPFAGGSGCSVKVTPVAFLVVKGDNVRMLPVSETPSTSVDRLIDMVPELLDKLSALLKKDKNEDSEI